MKPKDFRKKVALSDFSGQTAGVCPGFVQANLVVVDKAYAADFEEFCKKNPKPCPLLEKVGPGTSLTAILADKADLRNELPKYKIFVVGVFTQEVTDISEFHHDDLVYFLIGCSFSFEEELVRNGISLRHIEQGKNVSMYNTNIALQGVGPFQGHMVVSMRPIHYTKVVDSCLITATFPDVHGAPVHIGSPHLIGISDLAKPDYGDPVEIREDEIPVFWACGVTPQNALLNARLPLAMTHSPGAMFVSDLLNSAFRQ